MIFGLTPLGTVHTAISLIALATGLIALLRDRAISPRNTLGQVYLWSTVLTCLTGFGIFRHGGFGPPHMLGIVTLLVLALATVADRTALFKSWSIYVVTLAYSTSYFFHMIPGLNETFTRVPIGAPLFTGPDDPALQKVIAVFFVLLLIGGALQVRRLRAAGRPAGAFAKVA